MISLLGHVTLLLALLFSLVQAVLPIMGYAKNNPYLLATARPAALAQCVFVVTAFVLLMIGFAINDFTMPYIAANSHPSLPLMYRLTAVWGGHEGSILLWVLVLNVWGMVFAFLTRSAGLTATLGLAILGFLSFCFLIFLFFTSNPFASVDAVLQAHDLNPLLQDPGFVIHPPMLYTGYVGFSVAFAITLASLIQGKLDSAWARLTKQFAVAAWCFLTLGILLGSWWAYRVLGWGGFWFWDPVENASLLPWLAGTALIHVLVLVEKRGIAIQWAALLALICFALSIMGTFLVRSGVLISAHTFASDPARGVFLLLLLGILVIASLIIYLIRIPLTETTTVPFSLLSRDSGLLANSILLIIAMLTILLGTLYPLIFDALHLGAISVGAPYFNLVMAPLALMVLALMGFAPFCRWEKESIKKLWRHTYKAILISFFSTTILLLFFTHTIELLAFISLFFSILVILTSLSLMRLLPAMSLAHLGFAVLVIGVMLSSLLSTEKEVRIKPGDTVDIGAYHFLFIDVMGIQGPNYRGVRAGFDVTKNLHHVTNLYPEKRIYTVRDMVMSNVDIHPGIFRDLYIALGEPLNENEWSVRIYYKPFIRWIWFGGLLMIAGGVTGLLRRPRGSSQ